MVFLRFLWFVLNFNLDPELVTEYGFNIDPDAGSESERPKGKYLQLNSSNHIKNRIGR